MGRAWVACLVLLAMLGMSSAKLKCPWKCLHASHSKCKVPVLPASKTFCSGGKTCCWSQTDCTDRSKSNQCHIGRCMSGFKRSGSGCPRGAVCCTKTTRHSKKKHRHSKKKRKSKTKRKSRTTLPRNVVHQESWPGKNTGRRTTNPTRVDRKVENVLAPSSPGTNPAPPTTGSVTDTITTIPKGASRVFTSTRYKCKLTFIPGSELGGLKKATSCRESKGRVCVQHDAQGKCTKKEYQKETLAPRSCSYVNYCADIEKVQIFGKGSTCVPDDAATGTALTKYEAKKLIYDEEKLKFPPPEPYKVALESLKTKEFPGYNVYLIFHRKYGLLCVFIGNEEFCGPNNNGRTCDLNCAAGGLTAKGTWFIGAPNSKSVKSKPHRYRFNMYQMTSEKTVSTCGGQLLHEGGWKTGPWTYSSGCMTMYRKWASKYFAMIYQESNKRTNVNIQGFRGTKNIYGILKVIGDRKQCGFRQKYKCT